MFSLVSLIFMSDASPLKARGVFPEICSTFGQSVTDFAFTMYNNLWNAGAGVGYQCTTLEEVTEDGVRWTTTGSWALNDDQVKSYANVGWKPEPEQLAALSTLPTKWDYTVGCQGTSDVSYDIFTSGAPGGDPAFEVMIWLSKTGPAGPISATGKPIAQHSAAGLSFDLFKGKNQQMVILGSSLRMSIDCVRRSFLSWLRTPPITDMSASSATS